MRKPLERPSSVFERPEDGIYRVSAGSLDNEYYDPSNKQRKGHNMKRIIRCVASAARHPVISALGMREFRSGVGMTYNDASKTNAYDSGRELAHLVTRRRWDW